MSQPTPTKQGIKRKLLRPFEKIRKILGSRIPSPETGHEQVTKTVADAVRRSTDAQKTSDKVDKEIKNPSTNEISETTTNASLNKPAPASVPAPPAFSPETTGALMQRTNGEFSHEQDPHAFGKNAGSEEAIASASTVKDTSSTLPTRLQDHRVEEQAQIVRQQGTDQNVGDFIPSLVFSPATLQDADFDSPAAHTGQHKISKVRPTPLVGDAGAGGNTVSHGNAVAPLSQIPVNATGRWVNVGKFRQLEQGLAPPPIAEKGKFEFQHHLQCELRIKLDNEVLQASPPFSVRWYDELAYRGLMSVAETCIRNARELTYSNLKLEEICSLQYGSFIVKSQASQTEVERLDYEDQAAEKLATTIMAFFIQRPYETPGLHVDWNFTTVGVPENSLEPYTRTVANAIKRFEQKGENGKVYFPADDLFQVLHKTTVKLIIEKDTSELACDKTEFAKLVQISATKLLALCVYSGLDMAFLDELLKCKERFSNQNPPPMPPGSPPESFPSRMQKRHWEFDRLLQNQPAFFAHKFGRRSDDVSKFRIADHIVMPIKFHERRGYGTFSEVFRVEIHPQHQVFENDKNICFALKRLTPRLDLKAREEKIQQELAILEILQTYRREQTAHINLHYTAWNQGQSFCILFPLADMNLDEFMNEPKKRAALMDIPFRKGTKMPELSAIFVEWLLRQLLGLAEALAKFHSITYRGDNLTVADPRSFSATAYHHDIKPQNILVFFDGTPGYGTFKFTDFGSAHVKKGPILDRQTFYKGTPESSKRDSLGGLGRHSAAERTPFESNIPEGAAGYEAPDLWLFGGHSRRADVWSLGCVYIQLLDWCFDVRHENSPSFMTQLLGTDSQGSGMSTDCFWKRVILQPGNIKRAELKSAVVEKFKDLETNHCKGKRALESLVNCVKRMLAIHTYVKHEPNKDKLRLTAEELSTNLRVAYAEAMDKLRRNPNYYCSAEPLQHSNVARRPPPPSTAPTEGGGSPDHGPFHDADDGAMLSPQSSPRHRRSSSAVRREASQITPTEQQSQFPAEAVPPSIPQDTSMIAEQTAGRDTDPLTLGSAADENEGHPRFIQRSSSGSDRSLTFP